jgi:hypothetical protein
MRKKIIIDLPESEIEIMLRNDPKKVELIVKDSSQKWNSQAVGFFYIHRRVICQRIK